MIWPFAALFAKKTHTIRKTKPGYRPLLDLLEDRGLALTSELAAANSNSSSP